MRQLLLMVTVFLTAVCQADPLPSWNASANKSAIVDFVDAVTDPTKDTFVPVSKRIAVFDNDGTLWAEQPLYFQLIYALDRFKAAAQKDPSLITSDALKAAAAGDIATLAKGGKPALQQLINASHASMSVDEFQADVRQWLNDARHPKTGRKYTDMVYQPMLELLSFLRDNEFKTYIVSGGGMHFIRAFAESAYGIPPYQVVGSRGKIEYDAAGSKPQLNKLGDIAFVDDGPGKPVGIDTHIGLKPIFAGGNSDGDFQMLEWVSSNTLPSMSIIVHHTDSKREYAYDKDSHIGKLSKGLDEAAKRKWLLIDMKNDWSEIYPQN